MILRKLISLKIKAIIFVLFFLFISTPFLIKGIKNSYLLTVMEFVDKFNPFNLIKDFIKNRGPVGAPPSGPDSHIPEAEGPHQGP